MWHSKNDQNTEITNSGWQGLGILEEGGGWDYEEAAEGNLYDDETVL